MGDVDRGFLLLAKIGAVLLRCLRNRDYFMIFVPVTKDAIDAEQFEVFLTEGFDLLRRVQLATSSCMIVSFAH